ARLCAPRPCSTPSPVTSAPDPAGNTLPASAETASTSPNSTFPSVSSCVSTRITSPGATRYCFPPARITAYINSPSCSCGDGASPCPSRAELGRYQYCACCFPATACDRTRGAAPERVRKYRQTQPVYRGLWKSVKRNVDAAAIPQREAAKKRCPSVLLDLGMDEMTEEIRMTFCGPISGKEAWRYSPERQERPGGGAEQRGRPKTVTRDQGERLGEAISCRNSAVIKRAQRTWLVSLRATAFRLSAKK